VARWKTPPPPLDPAKYLDYIEARDLLMVNILKVMADNKLDAIVHKSVEHQPTFIKDGINPPYQSNKGIPTWNTFLVYPASVTVPSGFTTDNLPAGITFFGRPYSEPLMLRLKQCADAASAEEQRRHHAVGVGAPAQHADEAEGHHRKHEDGGHGEKVRHRRKAPARTAAVLRPRQDGLRSADRH
jgi:hypothetical protein